MKAALFAAAERGGLPFCSWQQGRRGARRPTAWGWFRAFNPRTISALRHRALIHGKKGTWDWSLTPAGYRAAAHVALEDGDTNRAANWLRCVEAQTFEMTLEEIEAQQ